MTSNVGHLGRIGPYDWLSQLAASPERQEGATSYVQGLEPGAVLPPFCHLGRIFRLNSLFPAACTCPACILPRVHMVCCLPQVRSKGLLVLGSYDAESTVLYCVGSHGRGPRVLGCNPTLTRPRLASVLGLQPWRAPYTGPRLPKEEGPLEGAALALQEPTQSRFETIVLNPSIDDVNPQPVTSVRVPWVGQAAPDWLTCLPTNVSPAVLRIHQCAPSPTQHAHH